MPDGATAICRNLFKKDTDVSVFENARVTTPRGEVSTLDLCRALMHWPIIN